ncbi:Ger(x)C family spore germination protein [Paenibacillus sp. SI8]|uniref:Ger(x)C family spore germination protein n=1 Tax=unclassified Paenibacillus TaxID=185978 RepID=UPI0034670026
MRVWLPVVYSLPIIFLLAGCGDKAELTEFGFAQAVALDRSEDSEFVMTTHFYNPSEGGGLGGGGKPPVKGITIRTEGDTIFDAIRDIPSHLGRKAKWDHMRAIIISEELGRKQNIREMLDFFSRDHEPRPTVPVMIAEGKAADYLKVKPFIEQTIGQQLQKMQKSGAKYNAKTSNIPLFDLAVQFLGQTNVAILPYLHKSNASQPITATGLAMLKDEKLADIMQLSFTESLVMLLDKYESGILEFPCTGSSEDPKKSMESLEVTSIKTKIKTEIKENEAIIHVMSDIEGSLGEFRCATLKTEEDELLFEQNIGKIVERKLRRTIAYLQNEKIDAIGVGNQIYRKDPALWKRWKPTWGERFAESRITVDVKVNILNSGMKISSPFGNKKE